MESYLSKKRIFQSINHNPFGCILFEIFIVLSPLSAQISYKPTYPLLDSFPLQSFFNTYVIQYCIRRHCSFSNMKEKLWHNPCTPGIRTLSWDATQ